MERREQFFKHRNNLEAIEKLEGDFLNSVIINNIGQNPDEELDDVKRVIECSAIIEPGRPYVDNLKEKIIMLLPSDIQGEKIYSLTKEIHELHPEQKLILAHLGEIYRLKNGPNFVAEIKNTIKVSANFLFFPKKLPAFGKAGAVFQTSK